MKNYFYVNSEQKSAIYHNGKSAQLTNCDLKHPHKLAFFSVFDDDDWKSKVRDIYYSLIYGMERCYFTTKIISDIKELKYVDATTAVKTKTHWAILQNPSWTVAIRDKEFIKNKLENEKVTILIPEFCF